MLGDVDVEDSRARWEGGILGAWDLYTVQSRAFFLPK
jgi:hypothetical protein